VSFLYLTVCYILSRYIEDVENSKSFLLVSLLWKLNILLCVDGIFLSFLPLYTLVCKGMTMSMNSLCEFLYLTVCYILACHIEDVANNKSFS
jgi:hypothetical protein